MFFPKLVSAVVLALVAQSQAFVYTVNVVYGEDPGEQPANSVKELTGQSADINFQYGGKYVLSEFQAAERGKHVRNQPENPGLYMCRNQTSISHLPPNPEFQHVWLTPALSNATYATGFDLIIQKGSIPGLDDLAKGAGGDYRYLIPTTNLSQLPINQLALYRTGEGITTPPEGWRGMTGDINANRKKTYLYLLWA